MKNSCVPIEDSWGPLNQFIQILDCELPVRRIGQCVDELYDLMECDRSEFRYSGASKSIRQAGSTSIVPLQIMPHSGRALTLAALRASQALAPLLAFARGGS